MVAAMTVLISVGGFRVVKIAVVAIALAVAAAPLGAAFADDSEQATLAAHQLAASQLPSGLLDFDFDFLAGKGQGSGQRDADKTAFIARQAGAAYVLAKYYAWSADTAVRVPLGRLIDTLGSLSLPIGNSWVQRRVESTHVLSTPLLRYTLRAVLDRLGLLYVPAGNGKLVSYDGKYSVAWAGTTALALLAELNYQRATGDNRFAGLRASWLAGMLTLHIPGRAAREYPASIEEAPYSDGESWLALATYRVMFPDDRLVEDVLRDYDEYLMRRYAAAPSELFYSWGVAAAATRFAATLDTKFTDFIRAQTQFVLDAPVLPADLDENSCALVEGLATAAKLSFGPHRMPNPKVPGLTERIDREMSKNRALQLRPGQTRLGLANDAYLWSTRLADYAGAFLAGVYSPQMRIDITGHCISALIEVQEIGVLR